MRENDSYFDIFFIYHPADLERARRIVAQLRATGVNACFNEDEFGRSADGIQRLKEGALRSYSVAFVMSPDSAESQLCNELLQYAVGHGKTLITLILEEEIEVEIHPAIAQNPYVFFRAEDDLGARVDELRAYLRADDNLVLHTELLVLAEKWRGRGRPPDLLLPRDRQDEARNWLATASARHPKPSALQLEYIHSSRRQPPRRARRRPRQIVLGILLVVALGAGVLLLLQAVSGWHSGGSVGELTSEARAQAELAAAEATAESDSAVGLIDQVAATGAGVRATVFQLATAESITATTAANLTQTAQALERIRATQTRATEIAQLERDEVAKGLVQAGEDALARGDIQLALALAWEAKDGLEHPRSAYRLLRRASAAGTKMTLHEVALIRLHPAGDRIAVTPGGDKLQIYDGESWALDQEWTDQEGQILHIAFSRDGERLVSASEDGEIVIRDGLSGAVEQRLQAHDGAVTAIALGPAGDTLFSAGSGPLLAAWDVESGDELAQYSANNGGELTLHDLIVSGDGERVIGWSEADGSIKMAQWSAETLALLTSDSSGRVYHGYDDSGNIGYSGGSSLPAYPGDSNTGDLLLWELSTSRQLARVSDGFNWSFLSGDLLAAATDDLIFISFYEDIALVAVDNSESGRRAALIDARDGRVLRRYDSEVFKMLQSAQFIDAETVLSATVDNRAVLWSSADGSFIREIASAPAGIESLQVNSAADLVVAKTAADTAHLWRLSVRAAEEPLLTISDTLPGAAISPSGDVFLLVQEDAVSLQQIDSQEVLLQLPASIVSGSGERIAVLSDDRLSVFDIKSGAEVRSWDWDGGAVTDLHLSPDGESALAFTEANELWLARRDSDEPQRLASDAARPRLVRFAPSGDIILTLQGEYALLWEVENGAARGAFPLGVSSGAALQAAFSEAGDRIYFYVQLTEGLAGLTAIDVRDNVASRATFVGVDSATLSANGQHLSLAFSDGRIRVISTNSGEVLHQFHSETSDLRQLRFLPQTDTVIAIAGSALNLWDAAAGAVDQRFAHPNPLVGFNVSRNGERILTRDESGVLRIWQVESAEALLARIAAENKPRELTCGERERYLVAPLCA